MKLVNVDNTRRTRRVPKVTPSPLKIMDTPLVLRRKRTYCHEIHARMTDTTKHTETGGRKHDDAENGFLSSSKLPIVDELVDVVVERLVESDAETESKKAEQRNA